MRVPAELEKWEKSIARSDFNHLESPHDLSRNEINRFIFVNMREELRQYRVIDRIGGLPVSDYRYMSTGFKGLDELLQYPSGKKGWRTGSIIELIGRPNTQRSSLCQLAAMNCMSKWKRGVIYIRTHSRFIDEEGNFDSELMRYINIGSLDMLLYALSNIDEMIRDNDVQLLVIDNLGELMPHRASYKTMGKITALGTIFNELINRYSILIIFNSEYRYTFHNGRDEKPAGFSQLEYISNIRVELESLGRSPHFRASIHSGFIPHSEGTWWKLR